MIEDQDLFPNQPAEYGKKLSAEPEPLPPEEIATSLETLQGLCPFADIGGGIAVEAIQVKAIKATFLQHGRLSYAHVQRRLKVGYNRARTLVDWIETYTRRRLEKLPEAQEGTRLVISFTNDHRYTDSNLERAIARWDQLRESKAPGSINFVMFHECVVGGENGRLIPPKEIEETRESMLKGGEGI